MITFSATISEVDHDTKEKMLNSFAVYQLSGRIEFEYNPRNFTLKVSAKTHEDLDFFLSSACTIKDK